MPKEKRKFSGHLCPPDPLEEAEQAQKTELSGKAHALAEKPSKLPKKTRSGGKESYYPMHRKK